MNAPRIAPPPEHFRRMTSFQGIPIEEMTRAELINTLQWLGVQAQQTFQNSQYALTSLRAFRQSEADFLARMNATIDAARNTSETAAPEDTPEAGNVASPFSSAQPEKPNDIKE